MSPEENKLLETLCVIEEYQGKRDNVLDQAKQILMFMCFGFVCLIISPIFYLVFLPVRILWCSFKIRQLNVDNVVARAKKIREENYLYVRPNE